MYTRLRPIANKIGREGKWEDECSNTCTFQDITFNSSVYESRLQFHPKNVLNAASCNSPKMPRILFRIINGQCRKFIWGCLKDDKGDQRGSKGYCGVFKFHFPLHKYTAGVYGGCRRLVSQPCNCRFLYKNWSEWTWVLHVLLLGQLVKPKCQKPDSIRQVRKRGMNAHNCKEKAEVAGVYTRIKTVHPACWLRR